jgi:hypothetical protein
MVGFIIRGAFDEDFFLGFFLCYYYYRVCLRFGLEIENCFIFAEFINSGKCQIGYFLGGYLGKKVK